MKKVNIGQLLLLIEKASLDSMGDSREKSNIKNVRPEFPNYESFWKYLVIPATGRIDGYPMQLSTDIYFRKYIDRLIVDLAGYNYSGFVHLVEAKRLAKESEGFWRADHIFLHLGCFVECVDMVLFTLNAILDRVGISSSVLSRQSKEDIERIAAHWYLNNYEKDLNRFQEDGKTISIRIATKDDAGKAFEGNDCYREYRKFADRTRQYRNIVAHSAYLNRFWDGPDSFLPKYDRLPLYRSWSKAHNSFQQQNFRDDFISLNEIASDLTEELTKNVDALWGIIVTNIKEKFYTQQNPKILQLYDLEEDSSDPSGGMPLISLPNTESTSSVGSYTPFSYPKQNENDQASGIPPSNFSRGASDENHG